MVIGRNGGRLMEMACRNCFIPFEDFLLLMHSSAKYFIIHFTPSSAPTMLLKTSSSVGSFTMFSRISSPSSSIRRFMAETTLKTSRLRQDEMRTSLLELQLVTPRIFLMSGTMLSAALERTTNIFVSPPYWLIREEGVPVTRIFPLYIMASLSQRNVASSR